VAGGCTWVERGGCVSKEGSADWPSRGEEIKYLKGRGGDVEHVHGWGDGWDSTIPEGRKRWDLSWGGSGET